MSKTCDSGFLRIYAPDFVDHSDLDAPGPRLWQESASLAILSEESWDDSESLDDSIEPQAVILKWNRQPARTRPRSASELLARTRSIYRNRLCRHCNAPGVEPVQQDDAALNRNRMPIPGTATLTGFRCHKCSTQWAV